jgi:cell division protein FtsA
MKSNILVALDIGSDAVKLVVGQQVPRKNSFEILAVSRIPSQGVRKGEIVRVRKLSPIIEAAIDDAEKQAGIRIKKCFLSINGSHITTIASKGLISVSRADQKISEEDIQRVIQQAQTLNPAHNKEILDIVQREFIIDGEGGIKEPLGLHGVRLELEALLVYVFLPVLDNLIQAVEEVGLRIENNNIIPAPLASARTCLNSEQRDLGVALVDMGAETTSLSVFEEGSLVNFSIIPVGSANITNDIAIGLRTEIETAENIKKEFGSLAKGKKGRSKKRSKNTIEIPEKSLVFLRKKLEDIVESRIDEIFNQVEKELKRILKQDLLPAGVVLTGGGSLLPGMEEYVKQKLKLPCRSAGPDNISGISNDPSYSTAVGILLKAWDSEEDRSSLGVDPGGFIKRIIKVFLP